jgi:hypothetical protein
MNFALCNAFLLPALIREPRLRSQWAHLDKAFIFYRLL